MNIVGPSVISSSQSNPSSLGFKISVRVIPKEESCGSQILAKAIKSLSNLNKKTAVVCKTLRKKKMLTYTVKGMQTCSNLTFILGMEAAKIISGAS